MKFQIKQRWNASVLFECELTAEIAKRSYNFQLGFAIKKAIEAGANLAGANLAGANLAGANLAGAYLGDTNLAGAKNVPETNGSDSVTEAADRKERQKARAERYRAEHPDVPVVEQLDAKILAAIESGGTLDMRAWHTCETTHCRAGWAITLAGEKGLELEKTHGPEGAGAMIYRASTGRVPYFYGSNAAALADIKRQAELMG